MANEALKSYLDMLNKIETKIAEVTGHINRLNTKINLGTFSPKGTMELEAMMRSWQAYLDSILRSREKLLTAYPTSSSGTLPFKNVGSGSTPVPTGTGTSSGNALPGTPSLQQAIVTATNAINTQTQAVNKGTQAQQTVTQAQQQQVAAINAQTQATQQAANAQQAATAAGLVNAPTTTGGIGAGTSGNVWQPPANFQPNDPARLLNYALLEQEAIQLNNAFDASPYGQKFAARMKEYYNNPMYADTIKYANKAGFGLPQKMTQVGTSGVMQLDYAQTSAAGIQEKLRLFATPTGRVLEATTRQFQTFSSAIARDVRELTKWSIAISLIYGPLNAMKTAIADMIEGQTKLADAMVATTDSGLKMAEIYTIVNQTASAMGESTVDSIEGFTLAYRATGNLGSAQERVSTATKLFSDALILAKISGMEESQAIDTLSASLRQVNMPLDSGTSLLDKWVKTTQVANVDLTTLATGFAVLGDAAETAGMDVDQLNGLLAAIAETGIASGKEVANTAKAIVAGFYGEKAVATLQRIGIATKDAEGNLRSFNEIATELYQQRKLGLISDAAFQEAARAIGGGGNRRQAAVTTLIENYARVEQVAAYSALANGEAQAAMGKRLDTVQTSTQRLNNAFQSLAMTLGNEGGLLDLFSGTTKLITGLVKGFDDLLSVMGRAGPMLLTILAGKGILGMSGPLAINKLGSGLDSMLLGMFGASYAGSSRTVGGGPGQGRPVTTFAGSRFLNGLLGVGGATTAGRIGGTLIGGMIPAISNLTNMKEDPMALAKAGGNLGGAIIGSLIAKSPLIGATIGSAIGEAMITSATRDVRLVDILETDAEKFGYVTDESKVKRDKSLDFLYAMPGGKSDFAIGFNKMISGIASPLLEAFGMSVDEAVYNTAKNNAARGNKFAQEQLVAIEAAIKQYKLENPDAFELPPTTLDTKQKQEMTLRGGYLKELKTTEAEKLLTMAQRGDITSSEYTRRMQRIGSFDTTAIKYMVTFGDELIGQISGIETATDVYEAFLSIISTGGDETSSAINTLSTELYDLNNDIERITAMDVGLNDLITWEGDPTKTKAQWLSELRDRVAEILDLLPNIVKVGLEEVSLGKVKYPSIVNETEAYSVADVETIRKAGREAEFAKLRALNPPEVTDEELNAYLDAQEDFGVYVNDFGKFTYMLISGLTSGQFQQTAEELFGKGIITTGPAKKASQSVQTVDLYSSQFPLLQAYTDQAMEALKTIPGYTPTEEELKIFGKDWIGGVIHGDAMAMRLALDKILAEAEKMNEQFGVWNLPEGASFMVPFTSMFPPSGYGGGSFPSITSTTETEEPFTPVESLIGKKPLYIPPEREDVNYNPDEFFDPEIFKLLRKVGVSRPYVPATTTTFDMSGREKREQSLLEKLGGPSIGDIFSSIGDFLKRLSTINLWGDYGQGASSLQSKNSLWGNLMQRNLQEVANNQGMNPLKVDLNLSTTTTVLLDGRVIATVVKAYLAKDLARMMSAYGKNSSSNLI